MTGGESRPAFQESPGSCLGVLLAFSVGRSLDPQAHFVALAGSLGRWQGLAVAAATAKPAGCTLRGRRMELGGGDGDGKARRLCHHRPRPNVPSNLLGGGAPPDAVKLSWASCSSAVQLCGGLPAGSVTPLHSSASCVRDNYFRRHHVPPIFLGMTGVGRWSSARWRRRWKNRQLCHSPADTLNLPTWWAGKEENE